MRQRRCPVLCTSTGRQETQTEGRVRHRVYGGVPDPSGLGPSLLPHPNPLGVRPLCAPGETTRLEAARNGHFPVFARPRPVHPSWKAHRNRPAAATREFGPVWGQFGGVWPSLAERTQDGACWAICVDSRVATEGCPWGGWAPEGVSSMVVHRGTHCVWTLRGRIGRRARAVRVVGRIEVLLPCVDGGTIGRTFSVGRVKKTHGLLLRQRSSATRISDAVRLFPLRYSRY